ncbi:MAG: iron ABC transporter permease, partial [Planctomycetota bacterium]
MKTTETDEPKASPKLQGIRGSRFAWPIAGFAVSSLVSIPILVVVSSLFSDSEGIWEHLVETVLADYARNTLGLASGVALLTFTIGVGCAWLVSMCEFPGRRVLSWALALPLACPTYLIVYAYSDLLQFSGPLQTWLRSTFDWSRQDYWFPEVRSLSGAVVLLSAVLYPYVYLASRAAFLEQSVCVLEVSRTLGKSAWQSFFQVALPLARPSIVAGLSLVLMETFADFGAVDYCAIDTFATGIYRTYTGLGSTTGAAQLSAVLLGFVACLFFLEQLSRRRAGHYHATNRYREVRRVRLRGRRRLLATLLCTLPILVGFVAPIGIFAHMTWRHGDARALELAMELGQNTFVLAAIASGLAVFLALVVAYGKRNWSSPWMRLSATVASLGYAMPGGVVALGVMIPAVWFDHQVGDMLDSFFGVSTGLLLSGTIAAVVMGYLVRFLAVALRLTEGGLTRIRLSIDGAAQTLGASR